MGEYWYKIVPVHGTVYKYKVVEYYGTENIFTCTTLRYFKDKKKAEQYLKRLKTRTSLKGDET